MSEYEPGTVALIDVVNREGEVIIRDAVAMRDNDGTWVNMANFGGLSWSHPSRVTNIRPRRLLADDEVSIPAYAARLALLEPERARNEAPWVLAIRSALDAYNAARTPQIEEPRQHLAQVWTDGDAWVYWPRNESDQHPWQGRDSYTRRNWEWLVSEGVRLDEEAGR